MTYAEAEQAFLNNLKSIYPTKEIKSLFFIWVNMLTGMSHTDLVMGKNNPANDIIIRFLQETLTRLKNNEPIQYILGKTFFADLPFYVNRNVLIPRSETEELVNLIVEKYSGIKQLKILDIGTGSGCIAITLAKKLEAKVYAIDNSDDALKTAKKNSILNEIDIILKKQDILASDFLCYEEFDIIVSNPPYVFESEKRNMHSNVVHFEPEEALFVPDNDPLIYYRNILNHAKRLLKSNGQIFFEINETQAHNIRKLLSKNNFNNIVLFCDIHGKTRFVKAAYYV